MKEELIKEMESNLSLVMDYNEYSEDCGYGDQSYIEFEYDKMAKELIDIGWTKPIWHKVAENTWKFIPRNMMLLFVIQYEDISTREMIKRVIPGSIDSESNCCHLHCASSKDRPNNRNTEDIITWTELPAYEE